MPVTVIRSLVARTFMAFIASALSGGLIGLACNAAFGPGWWTFAVASVLAFAVGTAIGLVVAQVEGSS